MSIFTTYERILPSITITIYAPAVSYSPLLLFAVGSRIPGFTCSINSTRRVRIITFYYTVLLYATISPKYRLTHETLLSHPPAKANPTKITWANPINATSTDDSSPTSVAGSFFSASSPAPTASIPSN